MKRLTLIIDNNDIIYNREKITYDKLCKLIKTKSKLKIIILNENIFFKIIDSINEKEIKSLIESEILVDVQKEDYLIHYEIEKKKERTLVYAIKGNKIIKDILNNFINSEIEPIYFSIRNSILKLKRDKSFKYKVKFMKKYFYINVKDGRIHFDGISDENEYKEAKFLLKDGKECVNFK